MITQRPMMGSRRNSGIYNLQSVESVLKDLDPRPSPVEMNRHHVETAGTLGQSASGHVVERQLRDPPALEGRYRFGRLPERVPLPRLHLDKHHRLIVAGD